MGYRRGWWQLVLVASLGIFVASADASPSDAQVAVHVVSAGDTLWQIARDHGVSVEALATANGLADPNTLSLGQSLKIPTASAPASSLRQPSPRQTSSPDRPVVSYTVRAGDTLWSIAQRHRTTLDVLLALNELREDSILSIGQRVKVPRQAAEQTGAQAAKSARARPAESPRGLATGMLWPSRGTITSRFGPRHHRLHAGIDIAGAPYTLVVAARSGIVTFAGRRGEYGFLIVVDHGNGLTTRYGHLASIGVTVGQRVTAGEAIGSVGHTGNATGWIVHFEVRQDDRPLNPIPFLSQ